MKAPWAAQAMTPEDGPRTPGFRAALRRDVCAVRHFDFGEP